MADSVARLHPVDAPNAVSSGGRRTYTEAFKRDVVEKVRGGMSISQVARTLGVSRPAIRAWMTESPPPAMSLLEAVRSGDRKTYLVRARDDLAKAIDDGMPSRERLQALRALDSYVQQIEELEEQEREESEDAVHAADEDVTDDDF